MNKYNQKKIKIKTLSDCIVSPRSAQAFYKGIDFEEKEIEEELEKINIIYPFYRYGSYEAYNREEAEYYIPGSSVKGAFLKEETVQAEKLESKVLGQQIMIDDFDLNGKSDAIVLKQIFKYQYLHDEKKQIKYEVFFPNVAFEMLEGGVEIETDFYFDEAIEGKIEKIFEDIDSKTRKKLEKLRNYLWAQKDKRASEEECEKEYEEKHENIQLQNQIKAIDGILKNKECQMMSLGGYKGLIRSILAKEDEDEDEDKGAIFIDKTTSLPYGIVEISLVEVNGVEGN